jgi:glycyl-tRNA synthetase
VHNRSDFDLSQHQQFSGKKLEYVDQAANKRYLPYVIETSVGADRVTLAVLVNALREEAVPGETEGRTVLGFHPALAPIKAGVFPLTKKDGQPEMAHKLAATLRKRFNVFYDEAGAIGRRYRRQDEAGTPFGITIDSDSTANDDVTIRFRDDMGQVRVSTSKVIDVMTRYLEADHARAESGLAG